MTANLSARAALAAALLATACTPSGGPPPSVIRDIEFINVSVGASGVPEVAAGSALIISVRGDGNCPSLRVNFGDDERWTAEPNFLTPMLDIRHRHEIEHTYATAAFGGFKAVTVAGDGRTCIGEVKKRILVTPASFQVGWQLRNSSACDPGPAYLSSLMANVVFIVDIPPRAAGATAPIGSIEIGPGAVYDADGLPDLADASFPFPGFRKYSVLVVVNGPTIATPPEVFQGGKRFSFRTRVSGSSISLCYNSDVLPPRAPTGWGNTVTQGFQLNMRADASNAVLP